jgi:hypothetical protein
MPAALKAGASTTAGGARPDSDGRTERNIAASFFFKQDYRPCVDYSTGLMRSQGGGERCSGGGS